MPLVAHTPLPTFEALAKRGQEVLPLDRALQQDIRELHIGLLNMMPDGALRATEQQFMRLVGSCNKIAQFYIHPFTIPGLPRSAATGAYLDRYYTPFSKLQADGLDALIITGANVSNPLLTQEPFWEPLQEVVSWAADHVTSVLCSCLATHALVQTFHNVRRVRLPEKRWGVYSHRITVPDHPLLRDINTRFDVPHSRYNAITPAQFAAAGLTVLVQSDAGDVHLAVSPDQFRVIYFQGHPEYDTHSLLKEYKREVSRFLAGELAAPPPFPDNYFNAEAAAIAAAFLDAARQAQEAGKTPPPFPESALLPQLDNTWGDTGKAFFNNWLGLVYRLTHIDRRRLFMDGVDPLNPLGLALSNP